MVQARHYHEQVVTIEFIIESEISPLFSKFWCLWDGLCSSVPSSNKTLID